MDSPYPFRFGNRRSIVARSTGVSYPAINATEIGQLPFPLLPLHKQRAIAAFLDRKTAEIDAVIAKKERLIALLQEERQALISRAVTRGLDADVAMKDSGIPWLGDVPKHWVTTKLKHLASFQSGDGITAQSIDEECIYPVYGGNGMRGYTSSFTHDGHYVLVGRQGALCGNVNYAFGRFWASEHAVVVTPRPTICIKWLGELLYTMNLGQYSQSAAQPGLSVEFIVNLLVPVPPLIEQVNIAAYLDRKTGEIDRLKDLNTQQITKLREYRQALISAAVTGKIAVPQEVAT